MGQYSIKQLEKLSGVKSHTIRIWEQRYGLLKPKRTETNIRLYDDEQLKKLLNISILNNHGIKISKISHLSDSQIHDAIQEALIADVQTGFEEKINALIVAMIELDEGAFIELLDEELVKISFNQLINQVIYPFLFKIGVMWGIDEINPMQEHFVSNLIRHKIISEINKLGNQQVNGESYALFLPEGEWHDIGLLMAYYELKRRGNKVIYLGQSMPLNGIKKLCELKKVDCLLTFMIKNDNVQSVEKYILNIARLFQEQKIFLAGRNELSAQIAFPINVQWLSSPDEL